MKTMTYTKNIERLAAYVAFYITKYIQATSFIQRRQYTHKIALYNKLHTVLMNSYLQDREAQNV